MNPQDYNQNPYVAGGQNPQNLNGQNPQAPQNWQTQQNLQSIGQFSDGQIPPVNGQAQFSNQPVQNFGNQMQGFSNNPQQFPNQTQPNFGAQQTAQPQQFQQNPQNQAPTHLLPNQQYSTNQTENPYTIEYLNSIAPKEKQSFWTKGKLALAAFAGLGLIFALGFMIFGGSGDSNNDAITRVYYHIVNLEQTVQNQQKRLKNSNLSALNAGLTTSLAANKTSLVSYMESRQIKILKDSQMTKSTLFEKVSKDYTTLNETLEEAFLKTTLDEVYAREMSYQISVVKSNIEKLKSRLNSKKASEVLDEIVASLETSRKSLSEFKE